MRALFTALAWLGIATLLLAVLFQSKTDVFGLPSCWGIQYSTYGQSLGRSPSYASSFVLGQLEGFQSHEKSTQESPLATVKGIVEIASPSIYPTSLTSNTQFALLGDSLAHKNSLGDLSSKTCYQSDFLAQSQKVGNFVQRTNNFRHAAPDSCSAPLTELVNAFYTNPIVPT